MPKISVSRVIDAPIDKVWAIVRDFNSLPQWHPRMVESEIENGLASDQVGCVRKFKLASGPVLREKLVALSDLDRSVTYVILNTPQPISNHLAVLRLWPVTADGGTFAEWRAEFDSPAEEADKLAAGMAENVFQKGLDALADHLAANG